MTKPAETGDAAETASTEPESAPPWGDDFDPARAWSTITAQRDAEKQLRAELAKFQKAQQETEDATKSEAEKLAAQVAERDSALSATQRELWSLRAAAKFGIPEDLMEFLAGDSEEAVQERAKRLAEKIKATTPAVPDARPKPKLTPGEATEPEAGFDAKAVAEMARKASYHY